MGDSACAYVKNSFDNNKIPKNLNKAFVTVIPKEENPQRINMFRPISLLNTSYKALAKVLASRLRPLLCDIIGPYQSSFVPSILTTDNTIITQEIIHSLKNMKSKKCGMIFKIDLENAYDRIS